MKACSTWFVALATLLSTTTLANPLDKRATLDECLASNGVPTYAKNTGNYTQAIKPFNLRVPITPASYAVPSTIKHIQDAVACGVAAGIRVSAKCGGHSYASFGLGGEDGHLVVDMRRFNNVTADPVTHTAVIQGGGRLGDIATKLYAQGKQAFSHGTCPGVGISGLTLHGGYGLSSRTHGLALDQVISMTVVLADSRVVTASATENPDLFWALRGAGGAFGIVVDYKFKTYDAPENIINFTYNFSPSNTSQLAKVLSTLQNFSLYDQPAELNMRTFVPGQLTGVYYGNRSSYDAIMLPLLDKIGAKSSGSGTSVSVKGWIDTLTAFAFGPLPQAEIYDTHENFYAKSLMTQPLSEKAIYALADYYFTTTVKIQRGWYLLIDLHGGKSSAVSAVPNSATAYSHRDAVFKMQFYDRIMNSDTYQSSYFSFLDGWVSAIESATPGEQFGAYINYADPRLSKDEAHKRYWGENYEKLVKLKAVYDPKKVFEGPQLVAS
ncbi:Glucooligosaccharide oxidase [Bipolaris oryzae ATCC 44560]|uniref:Glucooligosaccharide oxidase n=1 Tax=Bipolaris oryzae ATCC 44560 TaxID=930090 RepID=W6ZTT2_COCMI|nr:Glucooligosaccharide oxidase [Bipolaris oryzae ATCC 44560]EUC47136.1 Glucooligosaccharide oxidase [Bipolaris oryzae ATCC 44560]